MRVIMEYFVRPGYLKPETFFPNLKNLTWVKPFLGLKRDLLAKELKTLDLEEERLGLVLNPLDPNGIKGLILIDRNIGLFDADLSRTCEPIPETAGNEIPIERWLERPKYSTTTDKSLVALRQTIDLHSNKAEIKFEEAKKSHDEFRYLLTSTNASSDDIRSLSDQLVYLLNNVPKQLDNNMYLIESVYGAFSSKGPRYLTYPLPPSVRRWVILKGVAETAISEVIHEVKNWAESVGLPLQADRCPLYKGEIDRLLLPTLGVGIIDGGRHHPFEPISPNDIVINLDSTFIDQEKTYYYVPEIREFQAIYKQKMRQGTLELKEATLDFWGYNQMFEPLDLKQLLMTSYR